MKFGIYYAYWEKEWKADYIPYVKKVAELGFDILEIACTPLPEYTDTQIKNLKDTAENYGIKLTSGHGPSAMQNLASQDEEIGKSAVNYFANLLKVLNKLGITSIGGGLNSYWPVDFSIDFDKQADWEKSVKRVREVGKIANDLGIEYYIECLNRFEGYLTNTAEEGVKFVGEVGLANVKLLLDTFHMNIEEDSIIGAIKTAGKNLGRLHVGEANRKVPGKGRLAWFEIGQALNEIAFDGDVVMEPFVNMGGQVGKDIKIWRKLEDESTLDEDAKNSLQFLHFNLRSLK